MGANGASGQELLQIAPKNRFRANFLVTSKRQIFILTTVYFQHTKECLHFSFGQV